MWRPGSSLLAVSTLALWGCPESTECPPLDVTSETSCSTSQDCIDEGLPELSCVGGICRRPCLRDRDCVLEATDDCANTTEEQGRVICEAQLCMPGCDGDGDCPGGQTCADGRCVWYAESFEAPGPNEAVSLDGLGFDTVEKDLQNLRTTIAWEGVMGCNLGDARCAGIAGDGVRFVSLETVATPEKGTPEVDFTCRACACCLACVIDPPALEPRIETCGESTVPIALMCPASTPPVCSNICSACDQCQASTRMLGERLLACEERAASRTCSVCPTCQADTCASCRTDSCPACQQNLDGDACKTCEANSCPSCGPCRDCNVCSRALDCEISDPGSAECIANRVDCDAQMEDGCYPTPVNYPRAQLTDLEQSLVSPAIDLSGASGPLTLRFEFVPFNVGEKYRPGIQGTPASEWPEADQEVVVGLCAGDCSNEASWTEAKFLDGRRASFPPAGQRGNGLSLGRQGELDWGSGRVEVDVPERFRTAEFRFRFLPRLAQDVRVGIDNILIRSRQ